MVNSEDGFPFMKWWRPIWQWPLCAALLLLFIWPSVYNGQPFFCADTTAYIRGADAGFSKLTRRATIWSGEKPAATRGQTAMEGPAAQQRKSLSSVEDKTVLAGRSIYYGALLYFGHITGRLWPAVLAQAAAVLFTIYLTLKSLGLFTWVRFSAISLGLATVTPMAFFVSTLMPDIFAAVTILAVANLLAHGDRMPGWTLAAWVALLTAALLFHTSHVLIALSLLAAAGSCLLLAGVPIPWKGAMGAVVALALAFVGEAAFSLGVTRLVGSPPLRPPFLMARMIADGPGYRYLAANCPASQLAICGFVDRLEAANSDEFLWSADPGRGVFAVADPGTRRKLAGEQYRFAWATLAFDPAGQSTASLRDTLNQLRRIGLAGFNYDANIRAFLADRVPGPYLESLKASRAWQGSIAEQAPSMASMISSVLSLLVVTGMVLVRKSLASLEEPVIIFVTAIVLGLLLNAAICGVISRPDDRYQARVIWLLPLAAAIVGEVLVKTALRRPATEAT